MGVRNMTGPEQGTGKLTFNKVRIPKDTIQKLDHLDMEITECIPFEGARLKDDIVKVPAFPDLFGKGAPLIMAGESSLYHSTMVEGQPDAMSR